MKNFIATKNAHRWIIMIGIFAMSFFPIALFAYVQIGSIVPQSVISNQYTTQCETTSKHSLYEGQSFISAYSQTPDTLSSSREFFPNTNIKIYNPNLAFGNQFSQNTIGGQLPSFNYLSNGRPGTSHFSFGGVQTVYVYEQANVTYAIKPSPNPTRSSLQTQIIHDFFRKQIHTRGGSSYTMTFVPYGSDTPQSFSANPSSWYNMVETTKCQNFYVAKCGDGVVDDKNKAGNSTTDGKNGILVNGSIVNRLTPSFVAEECDDGNNVNTDTCSNTCRLNVITPPPPPVCTVFFANPTTGNLTTQYAFYCLGTNATSYRINVTNNGVALPWSPINFVGIGPFFNGYFGPMPVGNNIATCTVYGANGASNTCPAKIIPVTAPPPPPVCTNFVVSPTTGTTNTQYNFACTGTNVTSYQITLTNNGVTLLGTPLNYAGGGTFRYPNFGPMPLGNNIATCTVYGANGASNSCPAQIIPVTALQIQPTCTLHAYTASGTTIPNGSTVQQNTSANFRCQLTNAANLSTNPYTFNFTLGGSPISTTFMPQVSSGYVLSQLGVGILNATCTINGVSGLVGSCATSLNVVQINPVLQITKTLLANPLVPSGLYRPGDTVTFRIDFANIGTTPAINTRLWDIFPNSLNYIATGTQLVGVQPPYTFGTYNNGTNLVVEYSGFTLPVGAAGYMIVQGVAQGYQWANQTRNHTYIVSNNATMQEAHAYFTYVVPSTNVTITKTLTTPGPLYPGSTFGFTINVSNNGDTVNDIQIQDIWPTSQCIIPSPNYTSNMPIQPNGNYSRTLPGAFNQGQTITINLTGQVANDSACSIGTIGLGDGIYRNTGEYLYAFAGVLRRGSATADIHVSPTPSTLASIDKSIISAGSHPGDTVSYRITYTNNGNTVLSSFTITDYWPATLNYVSSTPSPFTTFGNMIIWTTPPLQQLQPGQSADIIITGTIR